MQAQISAGYLSGIISMGSPPPCSELVSGFGTCRNLPELSTGQPDISKISEGYLRVMQAQISAGYLPGIIAMSSPPLARSWSVDSELAGTQNRAAGYQKDIQGISQGNAGSDICRIPAGRSPQSPGYLPVMQAQIPAGYLPGIFAMGSHCPETVRWIRNLPELSTGHPDISKISEGYLRVVQAQISAGYLPGIISMGSPPPCSELVSGFGTCRGSPQGNPGYQQDIQGISQGRAGPDTCRIPAGYLRHGFTLLGAGQWIRNLPGITTRQPRISARYPRDISGSCRPRYLPDTCRVSSPLVPLLRSCWEELT